MKKKQPGTQFLRIAQTSLLFFTISAHTRAALSVPLSSSKPIALKCESLIEPLGIDTPKPLLSWRLQDSRWGAKQTAYQILVSSQLSPSGTPMADIWDSGRVASEQSVDVPYAGPALEAQKRYYWHVRVWG
jgi:alpha-L-rhamnosidase